MKGARYLLIGLAAAVGFSWGAVLMAPPVPVQPAFAAPLATSTDASYNWAGYVAVGGEYTAVSGTWTVPTVTPAGETLAANATWVGIGGVRTSDLIQAGTQAIVEDGTVRYEAWYEMLPAASVRVPLRVSPGDSVTVAITEVFDDVWHLAIVNTTTGRHYALRTRYESSRASAEWIEEMPSLALRRGSRFIPLSNFGMTVFLNGSTVKDGVARTIAAAGGEPLAMHNYIGEALALPSVLGPGGSSFSVMRTDALPMSRAVRSVRVSVPQ